MKSLKLNFITKKSKMNIFSLVCIVSTVIFISLIEIVSDNFIIGQNKFEAILFDSMEPAISDKEIKVLKKVNKHIPLFQTWLSLANR